MAFPELFMFITWHKSTAHTDAYINANSSNIFQFYIFLLEETQGTIKPGGVSKYLTTPEIYMLLQIFQEMTIQRRNLFQPFQVLKSVISSKPLNYILWRVKLISSSCSFGNKGQILPLIQTTKEKDSVMPLHWTSFPFSVHPLLFLALVLISFYLSQCGIPQTSA